MQTGNAPIRQSFPNSTARVEAPAHLNEKSGRVIGAAMAVHTALGPALPERLYEAALVREFKEIGLHYEQQMPVLVEYRGTVIGEVRLDLVVERSIVIELECVETVLGLHEAQLVSYMRLAKLPLGLLINFKVRQLREGISRKLNAYAL